MIWWDEKEFATGRWRYLLPVLLLFLSWMMVSNVKYPSFKIARPARDPHLHQDDGRHLVPGQHPDLAGEDPVFVLPVFFTAYLLYGFIRPRISRKMRQEIEEEDDEEDGGRKRRPGSRAMPELHPILVAGLTGLISGLLLSIPVGPINLTILNEGARRGFKWAALIGLGATVMEVIYCFIAFTGFASFFTRGYVKAAMELFSFVFMLVPRAQVPAGQIRARRPSTSATPPTGSRSASNNGSIRIRRS